MSKNIVLGVSGGIAAYKAVILTSLLVKNGYQVWVVMTESATQFVTPLTFQTISRNPVYFDTFDERDPKVVTHIDLADKADLVIVAPATANILGKVANGIADDMLTTTLMATTAPVVFAPAMNIHMYAHPAVQENMKKLSSWGYQFIDAAEGALACGYIGKGRLEEPDVIFEWVEQYFNGLLPSVVSPNPDPDLATRKAGGLINQDLSGKTVLITAGPTQEAIDPVRYITNRSSGKMGYALAESTKKRGANVILVTGKTSIPLPLGIEVHNITTAEEMADVVLAQMDRADWIIGTAAVADYRPKIVHQQKMKKSSEQLTLELVKTSDVLKLVGERRRNDQVLVGFAAETEKLLEHAESKLLKKNLDYIVVNDVSKEGIGFDSDQNEIIILTKNGGQYEISQMSKDKIADQIINIVLKHQGDRE